MITDHTRSWTETISEHREAEFALRIEHAKVRIDRVMNALVQRQQQYVQEVTDRNERLNTNLNF